MTRPALVLVAALLSGCAAGPQATPNAASAVAPAPIAALPPPAPIPAPDPSIGRLTGLAPPDLTASFGAPGFVRHDKGVEVWQYRNTACVLHVFLYAETSGIMHVKHAEARDPGGHLIADAPTVRACVNAVSAQRVVG